MNRTDLAQLSRRVSGLSTPIAQPQVDRVLLVSSVYPPRIGGPSMQTEQIARALLSAGTEVRVITIGDPADSGTVRGIQVDFVGGDGSGGFAEKLRKNKMILTSIMRIMREFQPTVLHAQTLSYLSFLAGLAARRYRVPRLLKFAGSNAEEKTVHAGASAGATRFGSTFTQIRLASLEWMILRLYDCIWVTSPQFQAYVPERYGIAPEKLWFSPNLVDLEPFKAAATDRRLTLGSLLQSASEPREQTILVVSRLKALKGVDVALQALALLPGHVRMRVVGDGRAPYRAYLEDLARELQVDGRVEFIGAVPPHNIADQYRSADIFVLPSVYEIFGIVLVEAMAAGVPIVATRTGGVPSVVEEGKSAELVSPGDPEDLAQAIHRLLADPQKRYSMVEAGWERVTRYDLGHSLHKLTGLYQRIASG